MEVLSIENLSFAYPAAQAPAIRDISLRIRGGEFVTLCGATGSGKSTLLRLLKPALYVEGTREGAIALDGEPIEQIPTERIGFVMQDPAAQIVTDRVWHELAFGLENLGLPQSEIARRVAEMAAYFGIESWFERSTHELSGGQMQLLNLASVMVMDPDVLVLDEPTAQLDPIAASSFIATLRRLNRELSLTVLMTEHRLEELIPLSDRLVILRDGAAVIDSTPQEAARAVSMDDAFFPYMPAPVRLYHMTGRIGDCPMDIRSGRAYIRQNFADQLLRPELSLPHHSDIKALELRDVYYRYDRHAPDALRGLCLTVYEGEIFAVVGGNGAGKSTALSVAAGLLRPYSGSVRVFGRHLRDYPGSSLYSGCLSVLPQDVSTVFLRSTVREELSDCMGGVERLPFDLSYLYDRHPYDISGGERQLTALAKVLAADPRLILLDEPTKGLDASAKAVLAGVIRSLRDDGITVVMVTHDVEFAAALSDRTAMIFRGECVSVEDTRDFFLHNTFYTTSACRMTRGVCDGCVTVEDIAAMIAKNTGRDSS